MGVPQANVVKDGILEKVGDANAKPLQLLDTWFGIVAFGLILIKTGTVDAHPLVVLVSVYK